MKVQEKVKQDMVTAMKNKEIDKVNLLKVLIGEFDRVAKNLSDEEAIRQIRKMYENAKQLNNKFEIDILNEYLPQMISEDELKNIINNTIKANNYSSMKDMGKVMGSLKTHPKSSQFDMKMASGIVKEILK